MGKNKLRREYEARIKNRTKNEDDYHIIGVEIKRRRVSLAITLENLAHQICSVSYLCKIERNKIEPNKKYLREICQRLQLSNKKFEYLYELKNVLVNCIHAYIFNDFEYIKQAYKDGMGIENYRYHLIEFIYYIVEREFERASMIYSTLLMLSSNMLDFDLVVFGLFAGEYHYYCKRFSEAVETVEKLDEFELSNEMKIIRQNLIFQCYYAMNRADTIYQFSILKDELVKYGFFEMMSDAAYTLELYLIRNHCFDVAESYKKYIRDEYHNNTISFMLAYEKRNITKALSFENKPISDYCKIIIESFTNRKEAIKSLRLHRKNYYVKDFNDITLAYSFLETSKEKLNYIYTVVVPEISLTNDQYLKDYFYNELVNLPMTSGKTRTLYAMYQAFYNGYDLNYTSVDTLDPEDEDYDFELIAKNDSDEEIDGEKEKEEKNENGESPKEE